MRTPPAVEARPIPQRTRPGRRLAAFALLLLAATTSTAAEPPMAPLLRDGDRVVLVGGTFIERDQSHGYLETILTSAFPDRSVTFRNLGWSGDTPTGISRARFGPVAEGYQHLISHVEALKPTVLLISYGANEAFEGASGLPTFIRSYETLLDSLAPLGARTVLISPLRQERHPAPLPDPTAHNNDIKLYTEAIRELATRRQLGFVDLFDAIPAQSGVREFYTDNGIHLTAFGSWQVSQALAKALGAPVDGPRWAVQLDAAGKPLLVRGAEVGDVEATSKGLKFTVHPARLPLPPAPGELVGDRGLRVGQTASADELFAIRKAGELRFRGLPPGRYTLNVDGMPLATFKGGDPVVYPVLNGELGTVERLRREINAKNLLYFHRWRPQNETYLFGFRKHEQGQNGREIPLFDPLVAEKEASIALLKKPASHVYELTREGEVDR